MRIVLAEDQALLRGALITLLQLEQDITVVGDASDGAHALKLVRALGYDMNTIEYAMRDGVPYAIDFMNPAPDMDINSCGVDYHRWCVEKMADMCIRLAKEPPGQRGPYTL